ncbi:MAG: DUF4372 domain-containing protein [Bacteroidales bacterium]|nr:DUF4372 domain-containing protein [Bacteroidales bacterium]
MPKGSTVFAQIMSLIPRRQFNNCVARYNGDYRIRNFSCYNQFLVMSRLSMRTRTVSETSRPTYGGSSS